MFTRRPTQRSDPAGNRAHARRSADNLQVFVDGSQVQVLDYSESGMRILTARKLRRVSEVTVLTSNNQLIRDHVAVMVWQSRDQVGFSFRPSVKVIDVLDSSDPGRAGSSINGVQRKTNSLATIRERLKIRTTTD